MKEIIKQIDKKILQINDFKKLRKGASDSNHLESLKMNVNLDIQRIQLEAQKTILKELTSIKQDIKLIKLWNT